MEGRSKDGRLDNLVPTSAQPPPVVVVLGAAHDIYIYTYGVTQLPTVHQTALLEGS